MVGNVAQRAVRPIVGHYLQRKTVLIDHFLEVLGHVQVPARAVGHEHQPRGDSSLSGSRAGVAGASASGGSVFLRSPVPAKVPNKTTTRLTLTKDTLQWRLMMKQQGAKRPGQGLSPGTECR